MPFQQFCNDIVNNVEYDLPCENTEGDTVVEVTYPEGFRSRLNVLKKDILVKIDRLDKISIRYIENAFHDMNKVRDIIRDEYHYEVNDEWLSCVSQEIMGMKYNDLTEDGRAIIKVLTVYLLIQNFI